MVTELAKPTSHGYHSTKQWNAGHVGVPKKTGGDWTVFSCKNFLFFQEICIGIAADHVSGNDL